MRHFKLLAPLVIWLIGGAALTDAQVCPFESDSSVIGLRDGDLCATFHEVDFNEFSKYSDSFYWLNSHCVRNYKAGIIKDLSFQSPDKILLTTKNRTAFAGWILNDARTENGVDYLTTLRQHNHSHTELTDHMRRDELVSAFSDKTWTELLMQKGKYPMCPFYGQNLRPNYNIHIVQCSEAVSLLSGGKVLILCSSKTYNNCELKKVDICVKTTYVGGNTKFNKGYWMEVQRQEKPFGKSCETPPPGPVCQQYCQGDWGAWQKDEPKHCAYNRLHFVERYRAALRGQPPCTKEEMRGCCVERKEISDFPDCYDYDETLKVEIKKTSCQNGGTYSKAPSGHSQCLCRPLFTGILCEKDACPGVCYNGGTCVPKGEKNYTCICRPGLTGRQCETKILICVNGQKCTNGGSCRWDTIGEKTVSLCVCPDGFAGPVCEFTTDYCKPTSCGNRGVCHNNTETRTHSCVCHKGYSGIECQEEASVASHVLGFFTGQSASWVYFIVGFCVTLILFSGGKTIVYHHRRRRMRRGGRHAADSSVFSTMFSTIFSTRGSTTTTNASTAR